MQALEYFPSPSICDSSCPPLLLAFKPSNPKLFNVHELLYLPLSLHVFYPESSIPSLSLNGVDHIYSFLHLSQFHPTNSYHSIIQLILFIFGFLCLTQLPSFSLHRAIGLSSAYCRPPILPRLPPLGADQNKTSLPLPSSFTMATLTMTPTRQPLGCLDMPLMRSKLNRQNQQNGT